MTGPCVYDHLSAHSALPDPRGEPKPLTVVYHSSAGQPVSSVRLCSCGRAAATEDVYRDGRPGRACLRCVIEAEPSDW